jgi:hypothetical protein
MADMICHKVYEFLMSILNISNGHLFLAVILIIHSQTQQMVFLTWVSAVQARQ